MRGINNFMIKVKASIRSDFSGGVGGQKCTKTMKLHLDREARTESTWLKAGTNGGLF
jgi:hypothetical protein